MKIPFIGPLNDALTFLLGEFDTIVAIINTLVGIAVTIYGFFIDKARFEDREVGKIVAHKAKTKGLTVSQYLK